MINTDYKDITVQVSGEIGIIKVCSAVTGEMPR